MQKLGHFRVTKSETKKSYWFITLPITLLYIFYLFWVNPLLFVLQRMLPYYRYIPVA